MTTTQMKMIRQQPACHECQAVREAVAIANALECDNCLMLVEVQVQVQLSGGSKITE